MPGWGKNKQANKTVAEFLASKHCKTRNASAQTRHIQNGEKVFVNFLSKLSDELENGQKSHKTESVALGSAEFR